MTSLNETISTRRFGVEIEFVSHLSRREVADALNREGIACAVEGYGHRTPSTWKITTDGSVYPTNCSERGMELVSPILSGADGLEQIQKACALLNSASVRARVNRTCGLHVHHDARDFSARQMRNATRLYGYYEDELDQLVAPSRRGNRNRYCASVKGKTERDLNRDRYHKLNLSAFHRHGTIEVRHFNGTTDAKKICGWVVFTQALIERAAEMRSVKRSNDPQYNLFWVLKLYKTDAHQKGATPEEKARLEKVYKDVRGWVKARKTQTASVA